MPSQPLFNEKEFHQLDQLGLHISRLRTGLLAGERRSRRKGSSLEFADYRNYVPGDDLRRLDWNLYARLDKPFVKLYEAEEDLSVHILIDTSTSMHWPPSDTGEYPAQHHKLRFALQVAAALAYIALAQGDRVQLATLHTGRVVQRWGAARGKVKIQAACQWLEAQLASSPQPTTTALGLALQHYAHQTKRAGLVLVLSDLLDSADYQSGLATLQQRAAAVTVLHVLAPAEIRPPWQGDWQLQDAESGATQELTLDVTAQTNYQRAFVAWQSEIAQTCQRHGAQYVFANSETRWDVFVLRELRRLGVVD
jgi:uncharacterized protein (DUF58 family)